MPRYKFVGVFDTILHDLSHGVNAVLHRDEHGQPDGSTVVASPGDEVETTEPYEHALMAEITDAGAKPKPKPRKAAPPETPEPPADAGNPNTDAPTPEGN